MKLTRLFFVSFLLATHLFAAAFQTHTAKFCVVGAGPAGIISVCRLIDLGVAPRDIVWVDTIFAVGYFGNYCQGVRLISHNGHNYPYFVASPAMRSVIPDYIQSLIDDPSYVPFGYEIVEPLQKVTRALIGAGVRAIQDEVRVLYREDTWKLGTDHCCICADSLILALGWKPRKLTANVGVEIPLDYAMTAEQLQPYVTAGETVAVFGDGNSARLVVQALHACGVHDIVNVVPEKHLGLQYVEHVVLLNDQEQIQQQISRCTKIIYAIGFERNEIAMTTTSLRSLKTSEHSITIDDGIIQVSHMDLGVLATFANEVLPRVILDGHIRKAA